MSIRIGRFATLVGLLAPLAACAQSARLLTAITNPVPEADGYFGRVVAAMGSDRVLIGAPYTYVGEDSTGAAYLYSTNGTWLTTFTNPTPRTDAEFGLSIAAVGSDCVLIGAPGVAGYIGAAYLFRTDGTLLTTFTNPTPAMEDSFGIAVAALGNDRVFIGASGDDTLEPFGGAAYLFNTNGTLLITLLQPHSPALESYFGFSVATVGNDRLLVGAPYGGDNGTAYLFHTNGTLVNFIHQFHPSPIVASDTFGWSVAAFGSDRVLIGAPFHKGSEFGGAAHLFTTNGTWLASFPPVNSSYFGVSVAAMGSDEVLVGAGAVGAGTAFLFSTNGTLRAAFTGGDGGTAASVAALGSGRMLFGAGAERAYVFSTETEPPGLSVTINTNPPPAEAEGFGHSVAMVGNDQVLVGAPFLSAGATYAGEGYLFTTTGTMLTTFRNPTPAAFEEFGWSVAAMGSDRILIGALIAKAVYLFRTDGALLTTFNNPDPASFGHFGCAVAPVGSDRVLIGENPKKAHLFSTSGTLLTTITNPTPASLGDFGSSVAVVGGDRVLIGGAPEKAHLFSTNGILLFTFVNPKPTSGLFGAVVAAMGNDRVLIGAHGDDTGGTNAGAAYLFSTNGTLLASFLNPEPAEQDRFGYSVAAVGSDRVLIGAPYDDTGVALSGAAYLFNTNGTLVTTFSNPAPAPGDWFGWSVAAAGNDRVLIGAEQDRRSVGSAYLFTTDGSLLATIAKPTLPSPPNAVVSWSRIADRAGYVLDQAPALASSPAAISWSQVPVATYQTNAGGLFIKLPATNDHRFYRLRQP